jgi:acyl-CoA-binding protein
MRRKKPPISEPPAEEMTFSETPEDVSELDEQLAGLPSENTVLYLWRMYDRGRPKYLHRMEPGEFDIESIKHMHGGGRFRYVVKQRGEGTVREGQFEIDGVPNPTPSLTGSIPSPTLTVEGSVNDRILRIEESLKRQEQTLSDKLLTLLVSKPSDDGEDRLLQRMNLYKSLFAPDAGSGKAVVETVKELLPLMSAGDGGSLWPLLIDKLGPMLEKLTVPQTPLPIQTPPPAGSPTLQTAGPQDSILSQSIQSILHLMLQAASRNLDPAPYATMAADFLTDQPTLRDTALSVMSRPDWFNWLARMEPRVKLQEAWWRECHQQTLELLHQPPDDTSPTPETPDHDSTRPPSPTPRAPA